MCGSHVPCRRARADGCHFLQLGKEAALSGLWILLQHCVRLRVDSSSAVPKCCENDCDQFLHYLTLYLYLRVTCDDRTLRDLCRVQPPTFFPPDAASVPLPSYLVCTPMVVKLSSPQPVFVLPSPDLPEEVEDRPVPGPLLVRWGVNGLPEPALMIAKDYNRPPGPLGDCLRCGRTIHDLQQGGSPQWLHARAHGPSRPPVCPNSIIIVCRALTQSTQLRRERVRHLSLLRRVRDRARDRAQGTGP